MSLDDHPATVLVVDDDPDLLDLIRLLLEFEGYRVTVALNGLEALDAVAARMPDLILLDLRMPVMDGSTFALELRRCCPSPPPIVVVTAADDARKRATAIQAAAWIAKPFEPMELLRVVAIHLANASRARSDRPYLDTGVAGSDPSCEAPGGPGSS